MKLKSYAVGPFGTNCYVLMDDVSSEIVVIDPGDNGQMLINEISKMGGKPKMVLLTHSHTDHTGAVQDITEKFNIPVLINEKDDVLTQNPNMLFSKFSSTGKADGYLVDGQTLELGSLKIHCIETPGHTPGGMSFLVGNCLFSGDTLFKESIGRTDFPGGDYDKIISSIVNKLLVLPEEIKVLPGHGPDSSVKYEKQYNPFIR